MGYRIPRITAKELADQSGVPFKIVEDALRDGRGGFAKLEHQEAIAKAFQSWGIDAEIYFKVGDGFERLYPPVVGDGPEVLG